MDIEQLWSSKAGDIAIPVSEEAATDTVHSTAPVLEAAPVGTVDTTIPVSEAAPMDTDYSTVPVLEAAAVGTVDITVPVLETASVDIAHQYSTRGCSRATS